MSKRRRDRATAYTVANPPLRSLLSTILEKATRHSALKELEDRRRFTPDLYPPARAFTRSAARIVPDAKPNQKTDRFRAGALTAPGNLRFVDARSVGVCIRRHQRREVLHALKRVGAGRRVRRGKWSEFSEIRCKK